MHTLWYKMLKREVEPHKARTITYTHRQCDRAYT